MKMGRKRKLGQSDLLVGFVHADQAFTLVELMITVAILAILATVAIPMYSNYVNRAKQSDAIIGLKAAQMAEEQFFSENNAYCGTVDMLSGFDDSGVNNEYIKGEYTFKVVSVGAGTNPSFVVEAVWKDDNKGIDDRWTISSTNIEPVVDSSKPGIKGYSIFEWLFD
jgi:type IV pilus assembly protein PilE